MDGGGFHLDSADPASANDSHLVRFRWPVLLLVAAAACRPLDDAFADLANPDQPAFLDGLGLWMDEWSTRVLLLLLCSVFFVSFLWRRLRTWRVVGCCAIAGFVLNQAVVNVLKAVVGRPRPLHPEALGDVIRALYERADTKSFPSGHAATSFACAVLIALWIRRPAVRIAVFVYATAVAVSRTYVGAHYLSDILAGAAIGWACMATVWKLGNMQRFRLDAIVTPSAARPLLWLGWLLLASWLVPARAELVDWPAGEPARDLVLEERRLKILLEPLLGPAAKISSLPDLRWWGYAAVAWAVVAGLAAWRLGRRARWMALAAGAYGVLVVTLALGGHALPGRVASADDAARWVAVELQTHIGDPEDGGMTIDRGLRRYERLGFDLVQPTHHNRWARAHQRIDGAWAPAPLFAMEWSSGDHRETPLHVLMFSRTKVPYDADLGRMVAAVKEAGGISVVAHYWRGDESRLPGVDELAAAGVDGFELLGRSQEYRDEPLRRQAALRQATSDRELLGLANSDFHGRRSASYQWCLIKVPDDDDLTPADLAWEALHGLRPVRLVTLERARPPSLFRGWLAPWWDALSYFREMTPRARLSWVLWLGLLGWVVTRFARRDRA